MQHSARRGQQQQQQQMIVEATGVEFETGTVYDGSSDDDDNSLPTIEGSLYTALQKEGFATEDLENRCSDNTAFEVGDETAEEMLRAASSGSQFVA
ncbi:MAG: hypothetical protein M1813_005374 [Trichoglossum hirsutum]|nr:MAG: hypothetical protein M1813_005374 [Trichoglossum hirsutum]